MLTHSIMYIVLNHLQNFSCDATAWNILERNRCEPETSAEHAMKTWNIKVGYTSAEVGTNCSHHKYNHKFKSKGALGFKPLKSHLLSGIRRDHRTDVAP